MRSRGAVESVVELAVPLAEQAGVVVDSLALALQLLVQALHQTLFVAHVFFFFAFSGGFKSSVFQFSRCFCFSGVFFCFFFSFLFLPVFLFFSFLFFYFSVFYQMFSFIYVSFCCVLSVFCLSVFLFLPVVTRFYQFFSFLLNRFLLAEQAGVCGG